MSDKPKYPSRFWHRRHLYPARYCEVCGKRLTPRIEGGGHNLETPRMFAERRSCGGACGRVLTSKARLAYERKRHDPPPEPPKAAMTLETRAELIEALRGACEQHPDLLRYLGTDNPLTSQAEALELGRARA
jgi:hypothetical protein